MTRITLVIGHLGLGGAERVLCDLADRWCARGVAVTLVTLTQGPQPDFYHPVPGVRRVDLNFPERRRQAWPKLRTLSCVWALRREIVRSRPDVVVSFLTSTNIFTLAAALGLGLPVVVSERIDPNVEPIARRWERLRRWLYPMAAAVVVQTGAAAAYFARSPRARVHVIHNAVQVPPAGDIRALASRRLVLGMGRLAAQKRFDRLIESFSALAEQFPDWDLEIWGEGPEREALTSLIAERQLTTRISLRGQTDRPYDQYRRADIFVLPSDYEGFPNALCEAMSCGVACVSTDCPSGPSEIIRNGIDGCLVPLTEAAGLSATLRQLMSNEGERRRLGEAARQLPARLSGERVFGMWNQLAEGVARA